MKKIFITIVAGAMALGANAQLLKNNLLSGYKEGDKLEKSELKSQEDGPKLDTWTGAFSSKPTPVSSPVIGKELSYFGYPENGQSIILGTPAGVKGNRFSLYPITTGKSYSKGVLYLSCLIEMSKVGTSAPVDILGLSASVTKASNRAAIKVLKIGDGRFKFSTNVLKSQAETAMAYECGKTHLVILKLDYDNQTASLFVNPSVEAEPEKADCIAKGDEDNVLKHAIRSISLRNRSGNSGYIGNIRLARTWSELFEK